MSFFTALTGLKGAQTDISTTSNNIANVGSAGFKKSRAEFGDIFSTTPLQTNLTGSGTQQKSITQQFSQGNIQQSTNTLDMAVSGQGFFALKAGGNTGQTVYTRNGAFNLNDDGYIIDSNGQFLLGYPVDSDGAVTDTTLNGAVKLQVQTDYGDPKETNNVVKGINLPAGAPVIASNVEFDSNDPETFSASSAVTIFDNMGNPKSATIFYIKTQNPAGSDQTYKYDTKMFVDGAEIIPQLTRATDTKGTAQFIDKFGQRTTLPPDPAYILEGKGSPLYRADDLGEAVASTPAKLTGLNLQTYLGDGKTVDIVTDPLQYKRTIEYHTDIGTSPLPSNAPFWGKDFLLVDVDSSGPVSVSIPPGTYNGVQLAAVVENALRDGFGDDKKIKLLPGVDNKFSIDIKKTAGDGKSTGLATPIEIDIHTATYVESNVNTIKEGLELDKFLVHAQILMTDKLNAYAQNGVGADGTKAAELGIEGKMFKKVVTNDSIPLDAIPTAYDVITVAHKNNDINSGNAVNRFLAYSNVNNTPEITAFDAFNKPAKAAYDTNTDGFLTVTLSTGTLPAAPEVFRFQPVGTDAPSLAFMAAVGSDNVTVKSTSVSGGNTTYVLDYKPTGTVETALSGGGVANPLRILAKPSAFIESYFQSTEGLVEGVDDVYYSKKIVVQEIKDAAKRESGDSTTSGNDALVFTAGTDKTGGNISEYKLNAITTTTNWVDDRSPAFKIGYDETNQRLTFDGVNTALGKGTGIGFDTFTVYSQKLDSGTNGIGIPGFGENPEIDLTTDAVLNGSPFVTAGPEVRPQNQRFGMQVEFDTVATEFNISSGTTGEALAANSAVGVPAAQSASSVKVGRYKLTAVGAVDPTDDAEYAFNKIGKGANNVMGFPRAGVEGYTPPTGLVSKPAIVVGEEALMDMKKAFTVSELANENRFTVVSNGVSALITVPPGNYKGETLAKALENRINQMVNPISNEAVGGVKVVYDGVKNNFTFTSSTRGDGTLLSIKGALKFGLKDVPLGLGQNAMVRTPVQAKDELGRPLFISPTGEVTANNQAFVDNMVQDFYPLYLDDGELTFGLNGEIISPITKVKYSGFPSKELTVDFSTATSFDQPFQSIEITQDGFTQGRLSNLEIDNYGKVKAGYSNGQNVTLGKIIIANFTNQSGLKQIGNSTFIETAASGKVELGQASEDGFGQILSGSLERSNVDITEELVNLITSQRNYQAAAKAIETSTSMTQTIINIRN
jgi:flagellar hook protein FlgE